MMRLRITVRRHGLPDTPVILPIDTTSAAPTISKLLEEVNDVVPIEAGEWGFEDYAVELRGNNGVNYECLHYQEVGKVMRNEDEVIIRPLLTQDLKIRRLSGRHQISADGKHLVDGLAFGRPLLRRPADRPPVNIPPRKRARLTYGDEVDDEGFQLALEQMDEGSENRNRELVIHADFDNDDEDEDDEDFSPGEEDNGEDGDTETDEDADEARGQGNLDDSDQGSVSSESIDDLPVDPLDQGEAEEALFEHAEEGSPQAESVEAAEQALADVPDEAMRSKIRALHSAFPDSAVAVCKHVLIGTNGDEGEAYEALTGGFRPSKPKSAILRVSESQRKLRIPKTRSRAARITKDNSAEDHTSDANLTADHAVLAESHDKDDSSEASTASGRAMSVVAEAVKKEVSKRPKSIGSTSAASQKSVSSVSEPGRSQGLTSTPFVDLQSQHDESSEDESDSTSSEGTTSSSGDESSGESASDQAQKSDTSSSGSDSDSSSESSSDDEAAPEETSSKTSGAPTPAVDKTKKPGGSDAKTQTSQPTDSAQGNGLTPTQLRNRRRRTTIAYKRCLQKGELPADTTIAEFRQLGLVGGETRQEDILAALNALRASILPGLLGEATVEALSKAEDFEARRQALLASLDTGGVDVDDKTLDKAKESQLGEHQSERVKNANELRDTARSNDHKAFASVEASPPASALDDAWLDAQLVAENAEPSTTAKPPVIAELSSTVEARAGSATPKAQAVSAPSSQETSTTSRRKLDMAAGRRLLFGALGIKTPKTKKDEEKVRSDLMKDIRPVLPPKETPTVTTPINETVEEEDPEAWRQKIIYRAVECCDEGVVLSEPPFPFVQRWDPQQQGSWSQRGNRGGKRKQDQRDQPQFYEHQGLSKKQKRRKNKHGYADEQEPLELNYDENFQDSVMETQDDGQSTTSVPQGEDLDGAINQQLMNDLASPAADANQGPNDLAPLPPDPATLPFLDAPAVKVGMTIAFKELFMSAATKWQPEMSDWRTAIIIALPEPGELHLRLALRDRVFNEKKYDEETGERIYDKFEMPGDDDDDDIDPEDNGILVLSYSQLISPKLLQDAPADLVVSEPAIQEPTSDDGPSTDESITMGHEEQAQFSHVAETLLQSDASEPVINEAAVSDQADEDGEIEHNNEKLVNEPRTPAAPASVPEAIAEAMSEPISDEKRKEISLLMKEAGFRSSVPSSVLRDMQLDGVQTPGDDAVFEKLMRDMTEVEGDNPSSPAFHSIAFSSPSKQQPEILESPSPDGVTDQVQPASQRTRNKESTITPSKIQSSWETLLPCENGSAGSPVNKLADMVADEASDWEDEPSSPPVKVRSRRSSKAKAKHFATKIPISRAQAMWEALQPKKRKVSSASSAKSSRTSQEPAQTVDAEDSKDSRQGVHYPKLAVSSSFTTQNTEGDHGRQPDFSYDDTVLESSTPKVVENSAEPSKKSALSNDRSKSPDHSSNGARGTIQSNLHLSSPEPELPSWNKAVSQIKANSRSSLKSSPASDSHSSFEEPLPTVDELLSQRSVKSEKKISKLPSSSTKASSQTQVQAKAIKKNSTSQKVSAAKPSTKVNSPRSTSSQATTTQTKARFNPPAGSQVMDLTISSDAEPDSDEEAKVDDDEPPDESEVYMRKFRKYEPNSDDDDEFEEPGWKAKKSTTLKGVEANRQTSMALRASSQNGVTRRGAGRGKTARR